MFLTGTILSVNVTFDAMTVTESLSLSRALGPVHTVRFATAIWFYL